MELPRSPGTFTARWRSAPAWSRRCRRVAPLHDQEIGHLGRVIMTAVQAMAGTAFVRTVLDEHYRLSLVVSDVRSRRATSNISRRAAAGSAADTTYIAASSATAIRAWASGATGC